MIRTLIAGLGLALAGCHAPADQPLASCESQRKAYDRAFEQAVDYGARQDFVRQRSSVTAAQNIYLAMQDQGCCRNTPNVCPTFNVH